MRDDDVVELEMGDDDGIIPLKKRENIKGRLRDPYGSAELRDDGSLAIRVDDAEDAPFWLEVTLTPEQVKALFARLKQ